MVSKLQLRDEKSTYKDGGPDGERAGVVDGECAAESRADKSKEKSRLHCEYVSFCANSGKRTGDDSNRSYSSLFIPLAIFQN